MGIMLFVIFVICFVASSKKQLLLDGGAPDDTGVIDGGDGRYLHAVHGKVSHEFSSLGNGSADGACSADDLEYYNVQDRWGMEAISSLHRQLDDDDNGNIDLSESDGFLREELKYDSDYETRQKAFHYNDDMHISVKELWEAWLRSEVRNWTVEQTTDWLAQSVQLPQYVDLFKQHKVTGTTLPMLAVNNMHYVSKMLGIKDPIHKQKIALKAMDVVLFGPPRETGTCWKDYILVILLLSAIIVCWYAYQQHKNAKKHLRRMAKDMEELQKAEQALQEMQKELKRARMEQENVATEKLDLQRRLQEAPALSSSNSYLELKQLKQEIDMLRSELSQAEVELVNHCWSPPTELQSWLQYTYELESISHMKKRIIAEKQLQSAREACEKLKRKRSSLVGIFVSTHGKSIDNVDRSIMEARCALSEVTNDMQERVHRWEQIDMLLGFSIVHNKELAYLESIWYNRNGSSSKSPKGMITNSIDDLDDDSVQGIDTFERNSATSGDGKLRMHRILQFLCHPPDYLVERPLRPPEEPIKTISSDHNVWTQCQWSLPGTIQSNHITSQQHQSFFQQHQEYLDCRHQQEQQVDHHHDQLHPLQPPPPSQQILRRRRSVIPKSIPFQQNHQISTASSRKDAENSTFLSERSLRKRSLHSSHIAGCIKKAKTHTEPDETSLLAL